MYGSAVVKLGVNLVSFGLTAEVGCNRFIYLFLKRIQAECIIRDRKQRVRELTIPSISETDFRYRAGLGTPNDFLSKKKLSTSQTERKGERET